MARLWGYVRCRLPFFAMYGVAVAICVGIPYFAGEHMFVALYGAGILTFFFFAIILCDAVAYHRKRRALNELHGALTFASRRLPEAENTLEADYIGLIAELCAAYDEISRTLALRQTDSLEYYTLWVHQIKTPIAAMRLLLNESGGEAAAIARQELFKIEQYAAMALKYIKLSDISRDLVFAPCSVEKTVRDAVRNFAVPFIYKKLTVDVSGAFTNTLTDQKWLSFILEQILSNAVKYTQSGGIRIYACENGLVVEDTGIGIRAEDLPRIFEKGYTGYNGRLDERASGIGLYLVKKAADALSIAISVESTLGKGTRVTLRFPRDEREIYE